LKKVSVVGVVFLMFCSAAFAIVAVRGTAQRIDSTAKGTEETAEEVDHIGEGSFKTTEGTVTHLDGAGKTITVKTADGAEQTFRLTDHAAEDAGRDISEGAEKSGKVAVYYTEHAGTRSRTFSARSSRPKI